jgi:exopolysaccharide biosynthesis polyprenyl glycosylphosphotransferase
MTPKAKATGGARATPSQPAAGEPQPAGGTAKPDPPRRLHGAESSRQRGAQLRRLLASGDWLAMVAALCIATVATSSTDVATLFWAVLFSPVWVLVIKLHGLYDHDHRRIRHSTLDELPALVSASALGTLALDGLLALTPAGALSPRTAILVGVLVFSGTFVSRAAVRFSWHRLTGVAVGLVIGPGEVAQRVARRIATHPEARLRLAGYLGPPATEAAAGAAIVLPRLGPIEDIQRVAQEQGVERVIVAEQQDMADTDAERLIEECKAAGLGLTFLPRHYGLLGPGIELNRLAELPVLDFRFSDPPRSTTAMKRAMDVAVSASLLVLLSPLLLAIALLILIDSGRPVLFRQRRAGQDGEPFRMVKFRTMVADAEERLGELVDLAELDEPVFKIQDDPRVTRVGRTLRRTSLDELPQLINVLSGSMSLVGPRPEEEAVVALYDERQRARLGVKPGITGPMQVYGRSDLTFEERLAMERDYLDNLSIITDLAILMRTPAAIVRGEGAY